MLEFIDSLDLDPWVQALVTIELVLWCYIIGSWILWFLCMLLATLVDLLPARTGAYDVPTGQGEPGSDDYFVETVLIQKGACGNRGGSARITRNAIPRHDWERQRGIEPEEPPREAPASTVLHQTMRPSLPPTQTGSSLLPASHRAQNEGSNEDDSTARQQLPTPQIGEEE